MKPAPVLSAGVVVVRREGGEWRLLLLRAYKNWDFPKGLVESGEDPLEAAVREAQEEAGLTDLKFTRGREYQETEPYNQGRKVARYYLAETSKTLIVLSVNPELGKPEHHEYRWLTFGEARKIAPPRLLPIILWAEGLIRSL